MGEPKLSRTIWFLVLVIVCWGVAFLILWTEEREVWQTVIGIGLAALGLGFGLGALFSGLNWVWWFANERMFEVRRWEAITPTTELARVISTLRPDQTMLIPEARYTAEIGVVPGLNGPEHFLLTPFMNIPLTWLDTYINELSSRLELYPVRRFANESTDQRYAQAFTAWACQPHLHLAIPASGPDPAKWVVSENGMSARDRCVEMIWGTTD